MLLCFAVLYVNSCIKPNFKMLIGNFDNRYVVDQLQCLGILQTCEVCYCYRYIHMHVDTCHMPSCTCKYYCVVSAYGSTVTSRRLAAVTA
jgi:hypothetical protein